MENTKKLTSKEKLTIIGKLIVDTCSYEEMEVLSIALLDALMKCRKGRN